MCSVTRSRLTLCNSMDYSLPGSSVHEFSRQEYWSRLPFPPPGGLPDPGIELKSPVSPALAGRFFTTAFIFSISLLILGIVCLFQMVLICTVIITNDVDHLFTCLLAMWRSLMKCLFKSLAYIPAWLSVFFLNNSMSSGLEPLVVIWVVAPFLTPWLAFSCFCVFDKWIVLSLMYLLWVFSLFFMINGVCILFNKSFPLPRFWWYSSCYLVEVSLFKFSHLVLKSTWSWFLCIAWDGTQVSPFCIWIYIWFFTIYWKTTFCPVLWKVILVKKQVSIYEWVCFWILSRVCQCICLSLSRYLFLNLL